MSIKNPFVKLICCEAAFNVIPAEDNDVALTVHPPIFPVPSFANSNLGAVTPFAYAAIPPELINILSPLVALAPI